MSMLGDITLDSARPSTRVELESILNYPKAHGFFVKLSAHDYRAADAYAAKRCMEDGFPPERSSPSYRPYRHQYMVHRALRDPRQPSEGLDPYPVLFANSPEELARALDDTQIEEILVLYLDWVQDLKPADEGEFDLAELVMEAKKKGVEIQLRNYAPAILRRCIHTMAGWLRDAQTVR